MDHLDHQSHLGRFLFDGKGRILIRHLELLWPQCSLIVDVDGTPRRIVHTAQGRHLSLEP